MIASRLVVLIALTMLCGCQGMTTPGTEAAARQHFSTEFQNWIAGQESEVATFRFKIQGLALPIGYSVRSVAKDKPDPLAFERSKGLPEGWEQWPAYKFNVAIEWKSKAGTPIEKISTYTLTWNPKEKKWYVHERL